MLCTTLRLSALKLVIKGFLRNRRGVAATEFALIVPLMLTMFFGTQEFASGTAANRKVTLVARTLSDLTSQSVSVADSDVQNIFTASSAVLWPYAVGPVQPTISEIYVNASGVAKIQWSKAATVSMSSGSPAATLTSSSHTQGDTVTIPPDLAVPGTYLIWSEVKYRYTPIIGYVMAKSGILLSDVSYTRPRQNTCVYYGTSTTCPTY